jgi:DNA processing protein
LPEEAFAVALAMSQVGPAHLRRMLSANRPSVAWAQMPEQSLSLRAVERHWQRHLDLGISVLLRDHPSFPDRLLDVPGAPALLFCLGEPAALNTHPTVAIVGTRAPTRYGIGIAAQFGADLSAAGASVVSGLALGIDGAAHEGACGAGAPPIGVVAGGLDEPYPRRHTRLWERVAGAGVIVSESPAGVPTEKWRFPVRNLLMAALSDVVVVVESRHRGGSLYTATAALDAHKPVGAVPGSIRSATSEGTNALLADGAFPVCSLTDVLVALYRRNPDFSAIGPRSIEEEGQHERLVPDEDRPVYEALTPDPASLDQLVRVTGLDLAALSGALQRLARAGVARDVGGWWERA